MSYESYDVCKFEKTCFSSTSIFFYVEKNSDYFNQELQNCCVLKKGCGTLLNAKICKCITDKSNITFVNLTNNLKFSNESTWLINQWSKGSHPSHFAFKMIPTGIIFGMREKFLLPKIINKIYWQDYSTNKLSEFEQNILDLALSHKNVTIKELVFSSDNDFYCFANTYTYQKLQVYSKKKTHLIYFQENAEKKLKIKNNVYGKAINNCPPLRAVLILRSQGYGKRTLLGENLIRNFLKKHKISLDKILITSQNSSTIQAQVFNNYGLIISPHSSQLVNLLFAQKKTVVLIASPFFYEDVFFDLAKISGLFPIKSQGHKSTAKYFSNPKCLSEKTAYSDGCYKTWRELLSADTILVRKIIEHDLNLAVSKLKNC